MQTYFRNTGQNYEPRVKTRLYNPVDGESREIELVVDTGFQGGVLIPFKTYIDLHLNLLEEPKITGKTAIGVVFELRKARVIIELNNMKILCNAYTTLGVTKPLLGREVLEKTGLLYKPPEKLKLFI